MITMNNDPIERQAAIDVAMEYGKKVPTYAIRVKDAIKALPPAQSEPSIPISWIEKQINWLKSMNNGFSDITAMNISMLVKRWKKENGKDNTQSKQTGN